MFVANIQNLLKQIGFSQKISFNFTKKVIKIRKIKITIETKAK